MYKDLFDVPAPGNAEDFAAKVAARVEREQIRTPVRWQFTKLAAVAAVVLAIGTVAMLRAFAPDPESAVVPPLSEVGGESDGTDATDTSATVIARPNTSAGEPSATHVSYDTSDMPDDSAMTHLPWDSPSVPDSQNTQNTPDSPPTTPIDIDHIEVHVDYVNDRVFVRVDTSNCDSSRGVTANELAELVSMGMIPLYTTDLTVWGSARGNEAFNLAFLSELTDLRWLSVIGGIIDDFTPLLDLPNLTQLQFASTRINTRALTQLGDLTNLELLELGGISTTDNSMISDISFVSNLTNLIYLDLSYNNITDVSPLRNLTNLIFLNLECNEITDVSPLRNLTNLLTLNLINNQISDVTPLYGLISSALYSCVCGLCGNHNLCRFGISLHYNPVTDEQIEELYTYFRENSANRTP
jgi:hypothetical protein